MATRKCHLTLEESVIARLEQEGKGTGAKYIAKGIETLILKLDLGGTGHASPSNHLPPVPVDPRNPTGHRSITMKLAKEDAAAKEKAEKPFNNMRDWVRKYLVESPGSHFMVQAREHSPLTEEQVAEIYAEVLADLDGSIAVDKAAWDKMKAEHAAKEQAEQLLYRQRIANGMDKDKALQLGLNERNGGAPIQTLRLSQAALTGLGLLGTPADMPDSAIIEENEHFAKSAAEQKKVFAPDDDGLGDWP